MAYAHGVHYPLCEPQCRALKTLASPGKASEEAPGATGNWQSMAITVGEIKLLTLEEVSEIIGIGPVSIRRWIRRGQAEGQEDRPSLLCPGRSISREFLTSPEPAAEEE